MVDFCRLFRVSDVRGPRTKTCVAPENMDFCRMFRDSDVRGPRTHRAWPLRTLIFMECSTFVRAWLCGAIQSKRARCGEPWWKHWESPGGALGDSLGAKDKAKLIFLM